MPDIRLVATVNPKRSTKMNQKFRPGGFLGAQTFTLTDTLLKFSGAYVGSFIVARKDIETVTVDQKSMGKSELKLIGKGTTLASVVLPTNWSKKSMEWILKNK